MKSSSYTFYLTVRCEVLYLHKICLPVFCYFNHALVLAIAKELEAQIKIGGRSGSQEFSYKDLKVALHTETMVGS